MLTIEKTVLPSPEQWEIIIEGMRNPKNSWDKIDSRILSPDGDPADFAMGDNQTVHSFEAEALAGGCGGSNAFWTYTIFADDAEDVA